MRVLLVLMMMLFAQLVYAESAQSKRDKHLIASVAFIKPDSARDGRAGRGLGLGYSVPVAEKWNFDWRFFHSTVGVSGYDSDFVFDAATFDMRYEFGRYKQFAHYWLGGVGMQKTTIGGLEGTTAMYSAGVGTAYPLEHDLSLRADLRLRNDAFSQWRGETGFVDWMFFLSLDIPVR